MTNILPHIASEHAREAMMLHDARDRLTSVGDAGLEGLTRLDRRIDAHLDGLVVARLSVREVYALLAHDFTRGEAFVLTALALRTHDIASLENLLPLARHSLALREGVLAGFGWTPRDSLRGVMVPLKRSSDPYRRMVAVAACAMHRVDPGIASYVQDEDTGVRARAFRAAGELGERELLSLCARSATHEDPACQFWAAWSAVLLGDREGALHRLQVLSFPDGPHSARALQLALQATTVQQGHTLLQSRAGDPNTLRHIIKGAGFIGDPKYVPWLIDHMMTEKLARVAGEAFTTITGLDLGRPPFERTRPERFESGPSEDPRDGNVVLDEDDSLVWPDQASVQAWWGQNETRFPIGVRHFMGAALSRDHCINVLKNGYQRQRIAAAYYLCLLNPGTPLFEWRAPAWRQQRELATL
jgi:uncharacterized protein (TIGR02270 family)